MALNAPAPKTALAAWSGVAVPPLVWLAYQQGLGELVYVACTAGGPPLGPLAGAACAAVCLGSGWASWRRRREAATSARRFICLVGAGLGPLFALGVLMVMAASLVIPPCAR